MYQSLNQRLAEFYANYVQLKLSGRKLCWQRSTCNENTAINFVETYSAAYIGSGFTQHHRAFTNA